MNIMQPPLIREELRQEAELAAEVGRKLAARDFAPPGGDPMMDALVHVFARYCELLVERLNRVPQSYHESFLRMLGATPSPAIPARVPLSFTPVKSTQGLTAIVPRSTQVSAQAEDEPGSADSLVLFETIKDLVLVQAELKRAIAVDTWRLTCFAVDGILSTETLGPPAGQASPANAAPLERVMYISQPAIIGAPKLTRFSVKLELDRSASLPQGWEIEWGIPSGTAFVPLAPELDSTANLTQSGELIFLPPEKWSAQTIASETSPWLACRLRVPDDPGPPVPSSFVLDQNKAYTALINRIEVSGYRNLDAVPLSSAFNNGIPLDISRDFFPLGERPRFGDVFYVLSEIFAVPGTKAVLHIKLTNPFDAIDSPIPPVSKRGNPTLRWEGHTARGWVALNYTDSTFSLTQHGIVEFHVPTDATPAIINGTGGGWVRARLVNGNYAAEEASTPNAGLSPIHPPAIEVMRLTSTQEVGPMLPECSIVESDLVYRKKNLAVPFNPFPIPAEKGFMLYLALSAPRGASALNGQVLSVYSVPREGGRRVFRQKDISSKGGAIPSWQARTADGGWRDCKIKDATRGLRSPGIIEIEMPEDVSKWQDSAVDPDRQFFWLRTVWRTWDANQLPCPVNLVPQRLLLNTVPASQTLRLVDELLGSSNGRPKQVFHTLHLPIIGGVTLQVREPVIGTDGQAGRGAETARSDFGSINIPRVSANEEWISWSEVADFSNSDSHSCHYVLDRLKGSVRFGDGISGRIPPSSANNIRMHEYHTGGGKRGNRPAASVTELHTTIPYLASVVNHLPAAGGQDQEDLDSLSCGAATFLRHRDRAVSIDDYADLACKASPEVARAKCMPACDVQGGHGDQGDQSGLEYEARPGSICVIVVPKNGGERSSLHDGMRPQPSFELLKNVKEFLDHRKPVGIDLTLLGPEYVSIGITVELAWVSDRPSALALTNVETRLNQFLHPITGGPRGFGWDFGQRPHVSDFYPLLGALEGLDYIRSLELHFGEERPGLLASGAFLICPGKHEIRLC